MKYALIRIAEAADWQVYHAIRRSSLWEERGLNGYDDARPQERFAHHHALLLKLDEAGIGTTRLDDLQDDTGIVRLVAITASLRRQGHGRVLDMMVEDYAREIGLSGLFVSAASDAEEFYTATSWTRVTAQALELLGNADGCVRMTKSIVHQGGWRTVRIPKLWVTVNRRIMSGKQQISLQDNKSYLTEIQSVKWILVLREG